MICKYLKPDPENPDYYLCGKIVGACTGPSGAPRKCPAYQKLIADIFDDEIEKQRKDENNGRSI